jgi:hypothetical protein
MASVASLTSFQYFSNFMILTKIEKKAEKKYGEEEHRKILAVE